MQPARHATCVLLMEALPFDEDGSLSCSPDSAPTQVFTMGPGVATTGVEGRSKRDYQVLIVVELMIDG